MGVQGFQDYIEKHCPSAVVPVELQKLARGSLVGGGRQRPPHTPLRLLVDADNCLHRLYGGFYTDWVSGGQWNHMLGYLAALAKACFGGNIELFVFFNGALEGAAARVGQAAGQRAPDGAADRQPCPEQGHPAAQGLVPAARLHGALHPPGAHPLPRQGCTEH